MRSIVREAWRAQFPGALLWLVSGSRLLVTAVVAGVLADLIILPMVMTDSLLGPIRLFRSFTATETRQLAGEWFLLNFLAGAAILFWLAERKPRQGSPADASKYGSHGTARWARTAELRKHLQREGPGIILGHVGDGPLILPDDPAGPSPYNRNVTILGSSGTRKTRSYVQPNILQEAQYGKSSLVVMDPKGENYRRSARILKEAGYRVGLLNFINPASSDRWNPLDTVRSITDAADLAVNIVANTTNPNRPRGGDPFWDNAEQAFITALVLYIKHHRPPAEQHMQSVLELGAGLHPDNLDYLFLALPKGDPARRYYRTFLRAEEKIRSGVVAGIGSRLQLWNIPEIAELTARSDFVLADLGNRPMALFLVIPDSKPTYAPLLALYWQQLFQEIYRFADEHSGALPVPVRCIMDEIANCGYIPDYGQKKSTMRSRRISTEEIWQSLPQLKARYPQTWSELLGNSDHLVILGVNDLETAEYVSKLTGTTTINVESSGATNSTESGSTSTGLSYTGRPLLTMDEVRRLDPAKALLFPKGQFAAQVTKVDFTAHALAGMIIEVDPHGYTPPPREPLVVIDVDLILKEVLPNEEEHGADPTESGPAPIDPTQFLDEDEDDEDPEKREEASD